MTTTAITAQNCSYTVESDSTFAARSRLYSLMTIGPVSPISFSGSPLFLNAFNTVDGFLDANRLTATSGNPANEAR